MLSEANLELMHSFAKETVARNHDGLRKILHPDIVVHEAPSLPYGGDHHGVDAYLRLFEKVAEVWQFTTGFEYTYYNSDADAVILQVNVNAIARTTGKPISLRLSEIFKIKDGQIHDLDVYYWDTDAMVAALTPEAASA